MAERIGFLYCGRRPCGRVSAMCWDDPGYEKSTAKLVAGMIARGLTVERVERFKGEALPEMICKECQGKPCKESGNAI